MGGQQGGEEAEGGAKGEETTFQWQRFSWRYLWRFTGPGLVMSIAFIDPGNLESLLQVGAKYGNSLLWSVIITTGIGLFLQALCIRLTFATGKQLATLMREEYPKWAKVLLWLSNEIAIVCADIPDLLGTAFAIQILAGMPLPLGVTVAGVMSLILLGIQRFGPGALEALLGSLVATCAACFLLEAFLFHHNDARSVLQGVFYPFIPDNEAFWLVVSLIGAMAMPHNLFLHSGSLLTCKVEPGVGAARSAILHSTIESSIAIIIALVINMTVVIVARAATLEEGASEDEVKALQEEPLQNAPKLFRHVLGKLSSTVYAVSLLASGQSSTMTGTQAGQYIFEGFFTVRVSQFTRAFFTRLLAVGPAILSTQIAGERRSEDLIVLASVILSIQLPYSLVPLIKLVSSRRVCGDLCTNRLVTVLAWAFSIVVLIGNIALLFVQALEILDLSTWKGVTLAICFVGSPSVIISDPDSLIWLVMLCFFPPEQSRLGAVFGGAYFALIAVLAWKPTVRHSTVVSPSSTGAEDGTDPLLERPLLADEHEALAIEAPSPR